MRVADYVVDQIYKAGCEHIFLVTGGGAMLRDLDKLISNSTGIPVIIAEDPLTCVARGGGQALEIIDKYNIDLLSTE